MKGKIFTKNKNFIKYSFFRDSIANATLNLSVMILKSQDCLNNDFDGNFSINEVITLFQRNQVYFHQIN